MDFGGGGVVALVARAGAAGTGDVRRVRFVFHHFRTTGFHRCHGGHVKLHAADVEVLHPGALTVVVHPEVIVDALLRTLVEVATRPEVGVRVGGHNVGHPGVGFFEVNFVAPVVDHHVDVPDGAVFALEGLGELELAAVAFVTQTTNGGRAVVGAVHRHVFLIGGLEVRAVAGVAGKFHAERDRHVRRLRRALRLGHHVRFFRDRRIHFGLTLGQGFIHRFRHNGVDLLLSEFLSEDGNWAKRGDNRHG